MKEVLLAGDENVLKYLSVVMESVVQNISGKAKFHIMHPANNEAVKLLNKLSEQYNVQGYGVDNKELSPLTNISGNRWPAAAFYPLLAAQYLPDDINRVVTFDSDTLVVGNIDELFDISFDGKAILATSSWIGGRAEDYTPRGISYDFNSGVYAINLERWRELNTDIVFWKQAQNRLVEKKNSTLFDQDLLNESFSVLDTKYINKAYNVNPHKFNLAKKSSEFDGRRVLHYTNNRGYFIGKPWDIKFEEADVSNDKRGYFYQVTPGIQQMVALWWSVAKSSPWYDEFLREAYIRRKLYLRMINKVKNCTILREDNENLRGMITEARNEMISKNILDFSVRTNFPAFYNKEAFMKSISNDFARFTRIKKDNNYIVIPYFTKLKKNVTYKLTIKMRSSSDSIINICLRKKHSSKQMVGGFEVKKNKIIDYNTELRPNSDTYWDLGIMQSNNNVQSYLDIMEITIYEVTN